jgi:ABC-2 type transport system ATP-binding protein
LSGPLVSAVGVARRYGDVEALAPTDFELHAGETVALVGANGAGKSTLLAILAGALAPSEGSVETHARLGWVPQRPAQYARLSPRENLELFARLERVPDVAEASRDLLRRFSLPTGPQPAGQLSVGNRQRLNVALSLLAAPRVLVLDEPTASLDVRHEMELLELVRTLVDGGMAGLVVTHELNLAARFADRIVLLDRGRVAADGPPADVLTRDTLSRVFQWPVAVTTWCDGSPQVVPLRAGEEQA